MDTSIDLIETLYFKCQQSILLGKLDNAKMYFGMLEKTYQDEDKNLFLEIINEERMKELKLIKKQIESNKLIEEYENFQPLENDIEMTPTEIELEFDIVKKVCKNISVFEQFLEKDLMAVGIEHPTGKKDKCDLVAQDSNKTLYAIEFKLNKATHAIIGQIGKYCLHYKLGLINKLYDRV